MVFSSVILWFNIGFGCKALRDLGFRVARIFFSTASQLEAAGFHPWGVIGQFMRVQ